MFRLLLIWALLVFFVALAVAAVPPVLQLCGGASFTCALLRRASSDGDATVARVRCWGFNNVGQLGLGNTQNIGDNEFAYLGGDVGLPTNFDAVRLTCGDDFACVLDSAGAVRCWGGNTYGQLGLGNIANIGDNELPSNVGAVSVGGVVRQLTSFFRQVCVLLEDGVKVRCWGYGADGRLGYGNINYIGDDELPSSLGTTFVNLGAGVTLDSVAMAGAHACAVLSGGASVKCWGCNDVCPLGIGSCGGNTGDVPGEMPPTSVVGINATTSPVASLAQGLYHVVALLQSGELRTWGDNQEGQLGIGNTDVQSTSQSVPLGVVAAAVSTGYYHTCAIIGGDRSMRCWGDGAKGQLGNGNGTVDVVSAASSATIVIVPEGVADAVQSLASGDLHNCVVMQDSLAIRCWGYNNAGQLGLGHTQNIGDDELPSFASNVLVFCNDGFTLPSEDCDDGNNIASDGCAANCTLEAGWGCNTAVQPSVCAPCGDGLLGPFEPCDDGSRVDGDGCSARCTIEPNWHCNNTAPPSRCALCGNGAVAVGIEGCDDGGLVGSDGCSAACTIETGWVCRSADAANATGRSACSFCGDGIVALDETCDDQNTADGDGCSSTCSTEFGYACSQSGGPDSCALFNLLQADVSVGQGRSGGDPLLVLAGGDGSSGSAQANAARAEQAASASVIVLRFNLVPLLIQLEDDGVELPAVTVLQVPCLRRGHVNSLALALASSDAAHQFDEYALTVDAGGTELVAGAVSVMDAVFYWRRSGELLVDISAMFKANVRQQGNNITMILSSSSLSVVECYAKEYNNSASTSYAVLSFRSTTAGLADSESGRGGGESGSSATPLIVGSTVGGIAAAALLCCALCTAVAAVAGIGFLVVRQKSRHYRRALSSPAFGMASLEANAFEIDAKDLTMAELIGRGAAGQVYRGTWHNSAVAIKRIPAAATAADDGQVDDAQLQREAKLWAKLQHPNVVRFYGMAAAGSDLLLVCELMPGGSLEALMHGEDLNAFSPQMLAYAVDAARGLVYLHHELVVHRDIKPANLLISADNRVKLADFGISRTHLNGTAHTAMTSVGTPHYMAPEVIRGDEATGLALDIYSFGIVLWQMVTRRRPYSGLAAAQVIFQTMKGLRPPLDNLPLGVPEHLPALIKRCWHEDPAQRPLANELLRELEAMTA